jgi:hypothetical protein
MTMLVAGIIVLVAAFAPTSANAVIPNSALVPAGPATFTSSCTGADDLTNTLLNGVPGLTNPILLPTQITTNSIESPADGETFTLDLTWEFTLPASVAGVAVGLGNTSLTQQNSTLPLIAQSGATGTSVGTFPGPQTISLGDGTQDVKFQQTTTGTFTRAGTGTPVVLSPGQVTTSSATSLATLNLLCTPTGVTPLTLNDKAGPPPPPTTAPPPKTLPTLPPTTAAPAAPAVAATGTTRSTALARTGFHAELLYLGIALLGAGYALSLAGRRVARASARSG